MQDPPNYDEARGWLEPKSDRDASDDFGTGKDPQSSDVSFIPDRRSLLLLLGHEETSESCHGFLLTPHCPCPNLLLTRN